MPLQNPILPAVARFARDLPIPADSFMSILPVNLEASPTSTAATILGALATAASVAVTPAATASGSPHDGGGEGTGDCRLLGPFAVLVQLALGGLALLALVYKRWRERPQRPVKIWFFDVSKQVFGSVMMHVANVFMSMLTSGRFSIKIDPPAVAAEAARRLMARDGDGYVPNPCSWYLLNLGVDTTLGIPILIVLLRIITALASYTPIGKPAESIQSGNYGSPPRAWWWLKQSLIYFAGLLGMKTCVLIIFLMFPWISLIGDWALGWTEGNEQLQIFFVMMLFPLIMNALQYYIIDSFIKNKVLEPNATDDNEDRSSGSGSNSSTPLGRHGEASYAHLGQGAEEEEEELVEQEHHRMLPPESKDAPPKRMAYDPDVDGDSPTVIGSSSSRQEPGTILPKSLYPHE